MGKKRRYINRAAKFGKKMFRFLDKLDGTEDSKLTSAKLETVVSKIHLADRGNGTFSISVEGRGPGSAGAAGLEDDKVRYTVNGTLAHSNLMPSFPQASGSAANDRDNFRTNTVAPARSGAGASDVILAPGSHVIGAAIYNEAGNTAVSKVKRKTIKIVATTVDLSMVTAQEGAGGQDGQIKIATTSDPDVAAAATAGAAGEAAGRCPGEESFSLGTGGSKNKLLILVKDKDGAEVALTDHGGNGAGEYDLVGNAAITRTNPHDAAIHLVKSGGGAFPASGNPYTVTITPTNVGGTGHDASAVTLTVNMVD